MAANTLEISNLRKTFPGRVIAPGDPDYDQARSVFYGWIDRKPAVIIRVADSDEVAQVVKLARETGLELAIRSGGHNNAGFGVVDGGIVLDFSQMKAIDIDVPGKVAWVQPGATASEYAKATGKHGLVTGFGDTGTVGIGGLTLGGGVGYLVRKHGLTIDDLLAADVVTAAGELLHVDAKNHPDLFWAMRGGGGNFGVVTRFKFRLHELPTVYGGLLILPATPETVNAFVSAAAAAPEELSMIGNVMPAPPMPMLAEEMHGKLVNFAMLVYAGDTAAGEKAIAPFRAIATPLADMIKEMPYAEIYAGEEEGGPHPVAAAARTMFVDSIDTKVAETIFKHLNASEAALRVAQLRVLGGAMAKVPVEATAFAHRRSKIMVNLACLYEDLKETDKHEAWVTKFAADMEQNDTGAYVNFLADEGEERIRAAYPGSTWDRLAEIKHRYDPDNLFHVNQNIPPTNGAKR
jgi:FAD/FMN-containing dehydrogenase